ncbi:DUF4394 domain-containing protein [Herminiimonas fonticola]|uniref:Uncharacterized protein DUF4394 n=1 Tax=Herminiimonas fonticola TaxID=303380 RepID=A0A4R6GFW4_9BURK|nr:DUF4394 domain-containing protein [Herminiimonas fonticola]RBA24683.1 hypothetical protein Hfont_0316 [Herminiimonas fonticola]TDN93799.1 uncharacterized protein DUF4394 [Herminiimonas fonticola]
MPKVKSPSRSAWNRCLYISVIAASSTALMTHALAQTPKLSQAALPTSVWAVTASNELIQVNAAAPGKVLQRKPIKGLTNGEKLVGIDYRVSRGVLFGLSQIGRIYTINTDTAAVSPVGATAAIPGLQGQTMGFDFNPAADRIRVVSSGGLNLRLHPETGAQVDFDLKTDGVQADPSLSFAAGDINAGKKPDVVAAAYTYNKKNEKLTTNYAIDRSLGALLMQGSQEDAQPVVSPNLGQLTTIGSLGLGKLEDASFDISDLNNVPLAAVRTANSGKTRLVQIDLKSGHANPLGILGNGEPVVGLAIEP